MVSFDSILNVFPSDTYGLFMSLLTHFVRSFFSVRTSDPQSMAVTAHEEFHRIIERKKQRTVWTRGEFYLSKSESASVRRLLGFVILFISVNTPLFSLLCFSLSLRAGKKVGTTRRIRSDQVGSGRVQKFILYYFLVSRRTKEIIKNRTVEIHNVARFANHRMIILLSVAMSNGLLCSLLQCMQMWS